MSTDIDPLDASYFIESSADSFLLDIRPPEEFAAQHIAKSVNIALTPSFSHWANYFIPKNEPILIVTPNLDQAHLAIYELHSRGFQNVKGFHTWSPKLTANNQLSLSSFPLLDIRCENSNYYLLDVRTADEWNAGHVQHAHHLELQNFLIKMNTIPKHEFVALICASGNRSSIAASLLLKHGWSKVGNVIGGMQLLNNSKLPISYM